MKIVSPVLHMGLLWSIFSYYGVSLVTAATEDEESSDPTRTSQQEKAQPQDEALYLNIGPDQDCGLDDESMSEGRTILCEKMDKGGVEYLYRLAGSPDTPPELRNILPHCTNKHQLCTKWGVHSGCSEHRRFDFPVKDMWTDCALTCQSCDKLLYKNRCPLDSEAENVWDEPGALNEFFEQLLVVEGIQQWKPKVWSRPTLASGDTVETADYQLGPWLVTMDNVLTEEETQKLVQIGHDNEFERSDDEWKEHLPDGTVQTYDYAGRTAYHTRCGDACEDDEVAEDVIDRIEDITDIPSSYFESLELLRYEVGQKYDTHHDYNDRDLLRQQGVRMMTVLLYLNDVKEGGGTHFPHLNLTITPKRGRIVLWPNVLNEDPHTWDERTQHQALPVVKGVKYVANCWIHQRDLEEAQAINCDE